VVALKAMPNEKSAARTRPGGTAEEKTELVPANETRPGLPPIPVGRATAFAFDVHFRQFGTLTVVP
jgi:hypothetical protein